MGKIKSVKPTEEQSKKIFDEIQEVAGNAHFIVCVLPEYDEDGNMITYPHLMSTLATKEELAKALHAVSENFSASIDSGQTKESTFDRRGSLH